MNCFYNIVGAMLKKDCLFQLLIIRILSSTWSLHRMEKHSRINFKIWEKKKTEISKQIHTLKMSKSLKLEKIHRPIAHQHQKPKAKCKQYHWKNNKNYPKMVPKFCQNEAKMVPESNQNGSRVGVGKERCDKNRTDMSPPLHFKRFCCQIGSQLASKRSQNRKRSR